MGALGQLLHAPVQAIAAPAYDPATRMDLPGVLVRVEAHCAGAMDRMVAAGLVLTVRGRRYRVEPVTAIGQRSHVIPTAITAADLLHRAAAAAGRGRAGLHAAVLEVSPANHGGERVEGDVAARVLRTREAGWAGSASRREAVYTHPLTRAVAGILMDDYGDIEEVMDRAAAEGACSRGGLEEQRMDNDYAHWGGDLLPGDAMACAVAAGGQITVRGAGEHGDIAVTRAAWVRVVVPREAASRAAAAQASAELRVEIIGARNCEHIG